MKKYIRYKSVFKESSLSRLVKHMEEHDTRTITAYRGDEVKKDNQKRNASLLAKLTSKGYSITSVKGSYIENYGTSEAKEVGEHVFFVVDIKDKGKLKEDLKSLGQEFDQDSILFIPKGGKDSYLIGTNKTGYPGFNKQIKFSHKEVGKEGSEFFTTIKGRPFTFKEQIIKETYVNSISGLQAATIIARKDWKDISDEFLD